MIEQIINKTTLLQKLRRDSINNGVRPSMYLVLKENGIKPSHLKLAWANYAGIDYGAPELLPLVSDCNDNALNLLKNGLIVPTRVKSFTDTEIQLVRHFDDVSWGILDKDSSLVIFELARTQNDRDLVVFPSLNSKTSLRTIREDD